MDSHSIRERLIVLALAAVLALNYPILSLASGRGALFGIPSLIVYLFACWLILVVLTALLVEREPPRDRSEPANDDDLPDA